MPVRAPRPVLAADSRPAFPRHVKFRFDKTRDRWLLLAPERVLLPDDIAVAVLGLCDGKRSITAISAELAGNYAADPALIGADVTALLQDLADKGFVICPPEVTT